MKVTLEPHELKYIKKLIDEYGTDIVIIIQDEYANEGNLEALQKKEIIKVG